MENKIEIHNMNLHYGDFHALHDINLDIKENEITAFIGPSGCGKSTLLRSLNRMNDLVENCRITGDIHARRSGHLQELRRQSAAPPCRHGIPEAEPVPDVASMTTSPTARARTASSSRVQLDEIVETSLAPRRHLGRDQGQPEQVRARPCRAASSSVSASRARSPPDPEVLLMDEPTSALDPISTAKIEDLVLELKKDYTIVMVTHNMQQATRVSDTTAFFLLGDMIEVDDTEKLFSMPSDKRTEDYITGRFG